MDVHAQALMRQPPIVEGVAEALDDVEGVPSCGNPVSLSNLDREAEPSSDTGLATCSKTYSKNASPSSTSLNTSSNSTPNSSAESDHSDDGDYVFDRDDRSKSSATSVYTDDRDDESTLSATSDYADDRDNESTSSMISEYTNFNYKNGRRYHASPQGEEYWEPNDEKQNETLDIFFYTHHAFRLSLEGKLYLAPIQNNVQTVLDVGTGTGIWAIDFADEHPSARVIGTDISPIQPTWVPPNLEFQIDDCCQEWTFKEKFDCVHCRAMIGSIPDWNALTKQAFKALKPGGHIEFHERLMHFASDDDTVKESSSMKAWGDFWEQTGTRSKRAFTIVEDGTLETSMMAAGFADIEEHDFKMPVGPWPMDLRLKEIGSYILAALDNDLEGFVLRPAIELLGWSEEEALLFVARLRTEMRSGKPHAYILHKVVGRKPN